MELVRSILLELYLIGFDKQAKSSYNEILTPVLPSLVQYIKVLSLLHGETMN